MPRGTRKPSKIFSSVLENAKEQLFLESHKTKSFKHTGITGDERAAALGEFFRKHLPAHYGVAKGEAIDCRDCRTGQLDIIIYDADLAAPISSLAENILVPAESVLCVIEVKTRLTKAELVKCYESSKKISALRPFKRRFIAPREDGLAADDNDLRCLYILFAYTTDLGKADWVGKEYRRVSAAAAEVGVGVDAIDVVSVLDRGMIRPRNKIGKTDHDNEENSFLELYLHVVNFLRRETPRRPPMDWQIYTAKTSKEWVKLT